MLCVKRERTQYNSLSQLKETTTMLDIDEVSDYSLITCFIGWREKERERQADRQRDREREGRGLLITLFMNSFALFGIPFFCCLK